MTQEVSKTQQYDASNIQVLEGLEAVRKRPGMYIGSTSGRGLHHLVWEIVDNSIDEALAGYCTEINVAITEDNEIIVKDNGRGIPVDIHKQTGKSTVETVYTVLHAGGKFGGGGYKVSGGLHGVGASVVNALSEHLEVTVSRNGKKYFQQFEKGNPIDELHIIGESDSTGTEVKFKPDPTIFTETTVYDYDILRNRIRELAFLNKGLKITLEDLRSDKPQRHEFHYEGGISEYVRFLNKNKEVIHEEVIHVEGERDGISVEIAMQYNTGVAGNIYSFANNINTHEGGTHEAGFRAALTRIINSYAKKLNLLKGDDALIGEDIREGLTAIISAKHPDPQFEGQTKTKLGNSEVRRIADNIFSEGFERFLMENPQAAKIIIDKVYANNEIKSMIHAIGTGVGDEFDIEKARYHKVVIMTDADVDGAHIRTLLLTFFYRYMRPLVEHGYVYIAQPPLYKVSQGKKVEYAYDEKQLEEIMSSLAATPRPNVQRYKGLGEMNAEQLWETTMDPEVRTLLQVTLEDAVEADEIFDILMGDRVEPRREFIDANAKYVKNLDY